jgi:hypothetical protein
VDDPTWKDTAMTEATRPATGYLSLCQRDGLLFKTLLLVAVLVAAFCLRWNLPRPGQLDSGPQPRLDFRLIQERSSKVDNRTPDEVEALLGPPSPYSWEPEFAEYEERVRIRPDRYPKGMSWWTKWTDPEDEGRWVAVHFMGGRAYHVVTKGFSRKTQNEWTLPPGS